MRPYCFVALLALLAWSVAAAAADKFSSAWPKKKKYADPAITKAMEAVRAATAKADPACHSINNCV